MYICIHSNISEIRIGTLKLLLEKSGSTKHKFKKTIRIYGEKEGIREE